MATLDPSTLPFIAETDMSGQHWALYAKSYRQSGAPRDILLTSTNPRKKRYHLSWTGERLAHNRAAYVLLEHYPDVEEWLVSALRAEAPAAQAQPEETAQELMQRNLERALETYARDAEGDTMVPLHEVTEGEGEEALRYQLLVSPVTVLETYLGHGYGIRVRLALVPTEPTVRAPEEFYTDLRWGVTNLRFVPGNQCVMACRHWGDELVETMEAWCCENLGSLQAAETLLALHG